MNKIDLPSADAERVKKQIEDVIGLDTSNAVETSGKSGLGVPELLESIVKYLPAPQGDADKPLQALLIDSWYDLNIFAEICKCCGKEIRNANCF